jgi:Recombinase
MSRGHLYWILSNPIYVGRLRHKGQIHDGLHPAVIELEIWDRVQQKLESQTHARRICRPDDHSFLAGKLYDDRGNRMSASHASTCVSSSARYSRPFALASPICTTGISRRSPINWSASSLAKLRAC